MAVAALLGVVCAGTVVASASAQQLEQPDRQAARFPAPLVAEPLPEVSTGGIIAAGEVPFDPARMASTSGADGLAGGFEAARGRGERLDKFLSSMLSEALLPSISLADAMVAGVGGDELAATYEDEFSGEGVEGGAFEVANEEPGVEFASRGPEANEDEPLRSSDDAGDFRSPSLGGEPGTLEEIARNSPEASQGEPPPVDARSPETGPSEDLAGLGIPGRSPERSEPDRESAEPGIGPESGPVTEPGSGYELASHRLDGGVDDEDSPETQSGDGGEHGGEYGSAEPHETDDLAHGADDGGFYIVPVGEGSHEDDSVEGNAHDDGLGGDEGSYNEGGFGTAPEAVPEVAPSGMPPSGVLGGYTSGNDPSEEGYPEDDSGPDEEIEEAVENYLEGGDGEAVIQHISERVTRETGEPLGEGAERDAAPGESPPPAPEMPAEGENQSGHESSPAEQPHQGAPPIDESQADEPPQDAEPAGGALPREETPPQDGAAPEDTPSENAEQPGSGAHPERRKDVHHPNTGSRDSRDPDPRPAQPDAGETEAGHPGGGRPDSGPEGGESRKPERAEHEVERPDGGDRGLPGASEPEAEGRRGGRFGESPDAQKHSPHHRGTGQQVQRIVGESSSRNVRRVERQDVSQEDTMIRVVYDGRRSTIERVPPGGQPQRIHQGEMSFAEAVRLARDRYGGHPEGEFVELADSVPHERARTLAAPAPAAPPPTAEVPTRSENPTSAPPAHTPQLDPQPVMAETISDQDPSESVGETAWQVRRPVVEQPARERAVSEQAAVERAAMERQAQQRIAYEEQVTASRQVEARQTAARQAAYEQQLVAQQAEQNAIQQEAQEQAAYPQGLAAQQGAVDQAPLQQPAYEQHVAATPAPTDSRPSWQTSTVPQSFRQGIPEAVPQTAPESQLQTQAQPTPRPTPQPVAPQPAASQPMTSQPMTSQPTIEQQSVAPRPTVEQQAAPLSNVAQPMANTTGVRATQSDSQPAIPAGQSVSRSVTRTVDSSTEGGW